MLDLDGVLADFIQGYTELAKTLDPSVPITPTVSNPSWDNIPGVNTELAHRTWARIEQSEVFWWDLEPLITPVESMDIRRLSDRVDLYFTTARRGKDVLEQTRIWIHTHIGVSFSNIIVCEKKGELAKALGADFMLDDKAGNAVYAAYHCAPKLQSFILDRPYNQFAANVVGSKVTRVNTIGEYLEAIWKVI